MEQDTRFELKRLSRLLVFELSFIERSSTFDNNVEKKGHMHVFHIKGFSGVLVFLLAFVSVLALFLLLPATFMMVLWNALVFEGLKGPEFDLYQGFLLWGILLVLIKLIFKPEIQFQFQKHDPSTPGDASKTKNKLMKNVDADAKESAKTTLSSVKVDDPSSTDSPS